MERYSPRLQGNARDNSFKSIGETQIARLLDRNRIAYIYEQPVAVVDRGKTRLWYPDFYLPEYDMIIEYFGMNGNQAYDDQTKHKMGVYEDNGLEGLYLTEKSFEGDWPTHIIDQIEDIQKGRLDRFYNKRETGL